MEAGLHGEFDLPGFRFDPTEEELVSFYLRNKVEGQPFSFDVIGTLDLYRYEPWQLPDLAFIGEREWFFFVPVDKKCAAARRSRLTESGYWKATGAGKPVRDHKFECIGLKKTLVFYRGKTPNGEKTDWTMNEYKMPDFRSARKKDIVLCRIHRKATSQKTFDRRVIAAEGADSMKISAASHFQHDFNLMDRETVPVGRGLPCLSEGDGEELKECMSPFKDKKLKPPELEMPTLCVDKLFSPWIETWTPSILLSTPKEEWNNLMDHESVPMGGGLPYLNEGDGEELMECISPFKDNKLKSPKLQVPMFCVDKLFSPWIETWTPSVLLCTPKGEWNNISDCTPFSFP